MTSDRRPLGLDAPVVALLLAGVLMAALTGVYLVLTRAPLATGPVAAASLPPANVPPPGEIWLGTAYDPRTLALDGRATAFTTGATVALVAHLTTPAGPGDLTVRVDRAGTTIAEHRLSLGGGGDGDVVAWTQAFPVAGAYRVSVLDTARGQVLAAGEVLSR